MAIRKLPRRTLFLVLTLLLIGSLFTSIVIRPVQAVGAPTVVTSAINSAPCDGSNAQCTLSLTFTLGDVFVVVCFSSATCTISDSLANTWTSVFSGTGGFGFLWTTTVTTSGSDIITLPSTSFASVSAVEYTPATFGNTASAGAFVATPVTVTSALNTKTSSITYENFAFENSGGVGCDTPTAQNGQIKLVDQCGSSGSAAGFYHSIWNTNAVGTNNYGNNVAGLGGASITYTHFLIELDGTPPSIVQVTQCFGNCGSPPITLVNTNSTHTINFNLSITLLYEFQAPLSGFFTNVTVNLAKNYANNLQSPILGIYEASCPAGALPFTASCSGTLLSMLATGITTKGPAVMSLGPNFAVAAGQWVAVAVSSQLSGMDINDTNITVPIFQASGIMPSVISQANQLNVASKIGLWTFITGSYTITPPPSTSGPCVNNWAQLDCWVPAITNTGCNSLTPQCQTGSALLWVIILTIISFGTLMATIGRTAFAFVGVGYIFVFLFMSWFFIFVAFNLILSFIVIFFLFIGAGIFAKASRGTLGF